MTTVFVLTKLRSGVDHERYEKWVREYDYPNSRKVSSIVSYRTYRVTGALEGSSEFSYIERIDITDVEEYKKALSTPELKELLRQWSEFIAESELLFTEVLE